MKEITVGELLDAMEKNGWNKKVHNYFDVDADHVNPETYEGAACAFGQAALNLRVRPRDLYMEALKIEVRKGPLNIRKLKSYITDRNDYSQDSVPTIAKRARKRFSKHLDDILTVNEW